MTGAVAATIPIDHVLLLATVLFALGVIGLLVRRNLLFMLIAIEVMLNAAGLAFVAAGARWGAADGQVMFLLILAMAAAEVAIGLALALLLHQQRHTLDTRAVGEMRG